MRIVNEAALLVKLLLEEEDGWIGVDLDGTLARHTGWKGATKIGNPIPRMVRRVRRWVSHGRKVKLFTARADDEKSVNAIQKWLKVNELPDLPITNLKDKDCIEFWDDRAKAVEKNTGRLKESFDLISRLTAIGAEEKAKTHWRFTDVDTGEVIDVPVNTDPDPYLKQDHRYRPTKVKMEAINPKRVLRSIHAFRPGDVVRRGDWSYDQSEGTVVREIQGLRGAILVTVMWPQYQSEVKDSDLVLVRRS